MIREIHLLICYPSYEYGLYWSAEQDQGNDN